MDIPGVTNGFQYCTFPVDSVLFTELLAECDSGGPIWLMLKRSVDWTCYNPPYPWEEQNLEVSITFFETGEKKLFESIQLKATSNKKPKNKQKE